MTARLATDASLSPSRGDATAHGRSRLAPGLGLLFCFSTWATALRPLGSLPHGGALVCVYSAGLVVACATLWRLDPRTLERACRRLGHPIALGAVLASLCLFNAIFFTWNNSLKAVGSDSTGDDAIIEAFRTFAAGLPMYSAQLYDGSPISPGPLWVLLNGWLAPLGAHFLMTPLYLVAVWMLLLEPARRGAFTALVLLNPLVWTTSGTGHDHVAIGLAFVACRLWARRASGTGSTLGLSLAGAVLGTSRVVYAGVPLLLALCATKSSPRARWTGAGLGTLLTLATHAIFSAQPAPYQPAHLFQRGLNNTGIPLMLLGGVGVLLVLAWRPTSSRLASPHWFAAALLVPHAAIALGELHGVHGDVARWEGANYLLPALPALAYAWLRASSSFSASSIRAPDPEP